MTVWTELRSGVVWHGHIDDLARLVYCLAAHCTCGRPTQAGDGIWQCSSHQMLTDQHTLDHLAFARGMRQQILASEWVVSPEADHAADWQSAPLPAPKRLHLPRPLAYALLGLLALICLSGPLLAASTPAAPQVAAWQTR